MNISYFYPNISPLSCAMFTKLAFYNAEKTGFFTACLITYNWVWMALFKFSDFSSKL